MAALLEIEGLHVLFRTDRGLVRAVNGASLRVGEGDTVGLVGESGCGKSVTASAVLGLVPSPPGELAAGRILFDGRDLARASREELRRVRGAKIGMVFQDPLSALNPVLTIEAQLTETLHAHERLSRADARARALEALRDVGLPDPAQHLKAYPHQLSGGMRQRVMIAMAIVLRPALLIADEPTTALDVTVQAQLIALLRELKRRHRMAMLLISHDLGVVVQLAERIAVMYAGHVVEEAPTVELFRRPRHPYTRGLLEAVPGRGTPARGIPGAVPDAAALPGGCPFHPRCPRAQTRCREVFPDDTGSLGRRFACHNPEPEPPDGA
ncbi:MAG TPA: ABC transporter ATP-binding protein [bacterium]